MVTKCGAQNAVLFPLIMHAVSILAALARQAGKKMTASQQEVPVIARVLLFNVHKGQ